MCSQGDITNLQVDSIVNAANRSLEGSSTMCWSMSYRMNDPNFILLGGGGGAYFYICL